MPAVTGLPVVTIRGMRELLTALSKADRETRLGVRKTLRESAEPVRKAAESLAVNEISHIGKKWWKMRIGVSRTVIYVAPRQRGVRSETDPRRRPNLAELLMSKAMQPALDTHRSEIEHAVERAMDTIADNFNHD